MIELGFTELSVLRDQMANHFVLFRGRVDGKRLRLGGQDIQGLEPRSAATWLMYSLTPNLSVPPNANLPVPEFGLRSF